MDRNYAKRILEEFCSFELSSSEGVLRKFADLPGAVSGFDGGKSNFVYVRGDRDDRVLLVAHADTVWDSYYTNRTYEQELIERDGVYSGKNPSCGIGADDRAGCAILWLLKDSGHSLLVVDGEEHGQIGSNHLRMSYPGIYDVLNSHSYMIQFDRREDGNYKVYNLPVSKEFIEFVENSTGYYDSGRFSRTDIVVLCRDICGVNLSIGYHNEHTPMETIVFDEWFRTVELSERILAQKQSRYLLVK